ncbi:AarF/UbiB family protein [Cetobacterium sp. SF1]|uniref:AarF/UbiB family protein n=1 Tax=unclassified Cetobacterium TaxID=2630983 RepID=UPI003CF5443B
MFVLKFIRMVKLIQSNKVPSASHVAELDYLGVKAIEYYTSKIDLLNIPTLYGLLKLYNERNTGQNSSLVVTANAKYKSPILFNLDFFDDTPFDIMESFNIYLGNLKTMENVAIKVLRNNYKEIEHNIEALNSFHKIACLIPSLGSSCDDFEELLEYCKNSLEREYDLDNHHIALNFLKKINENYIPKYSVLEKLKFPREFPYLSQKNIYVSAFIENARPLNLAFSKNKIPKSALMDLINIRLIYLLDIGIFPKNNSNKDIIFDDYGNFYFRNFYSLSRVHKHNKKIFRFFLLALFKEDFPQALNFLVELAYGDKKPEDVASFIYEGEKYLKENFSSNKNVNFIKIILKLFKIAMDNKLKFTDDMKELIKELIFIKLLILKSSYKIELFGILRDFVLNLKP